MNGQSEARNGERIATGIAHTPNPIAPATTVPPRPAPGANDSFGTPVLLSGNAMRIRGASMSEGRSSANRPNTD